MLQRFQRIWIRFMVHGKVSRTVGLISSMETLHGNFLASRNHRLPLVHPDTESECPLFNKTQYIQYSKFYESGIRSRNEGQLG